MDADRAADVTRLADMLVRCGIERGRLGHLDADNLARVLMPTVDGIARQRAAEELEALRVDIETDRDNCPNAARRQGYGGALYRVTSRAAALRGPHA